MITLTVVVVIGSLVWVHEREPPEDPNAPPRGPSTVIGGIRKRAAIRAAKARQAEAEQIDRLLRTDGGER